MSRAARRARRRPPPPRRAGAAHRRSRADDDARRCPVIGLRRKIAQKMQEAKRRIPHFTYVEEVDVTELEALRARAEREVGRRSAGT